MQFDPPLVPGTLIRRYNRFLVDVKLDTGETITGSCPNTGSMLGLKEPGLRVWLSEKDSPTRKYRHTLELVEVDEGDGEGPATVGVNTGHPNKLVEEAIRGGKIASLKGYGELRREQKYGQNSRIDILLEDARKGRCYVEVKNVHLRRKRGLAEFPDSVTSRGAKHLGELADMVAEGHRAVMMFLIQRSDVKSLSLARDIDPAYGDAFDAAIARGVEPMAYRCDVTPGGIAVVRKVPVKG